MTTESKLVNMIPEDVISGLSAGCSIVGILIVQSWPQQLSVQTTKQLVIAIITLSICSHN